jgi:hypothetical protein
LANRIESPLLKQSSFELTFPLYTLVSSDLTSFSFSYVHHIPARELEDSVPLSIFCAHAGMLETLVIYLHEVRKLSWARIALILKRSPKTVYASYHHARLTYRDALLVEESSLRIPLSVFLNRTFGPLESLAQYLHQEGYAVSTIADGLGRHPQTIYTSLRRS